MFGNKTAYSLDVYIQTVNLSKKPGVSSILVYKKVYKAVSLTGIVWISKVGLNHKGMQMTELHKFSKLLIL